MSSTIQLKTGTGSAVPSSLTQGEVAINVDDGLFYYGSGSTNTPKQLESFTNITASGDISSSGDIIANGARFGGASALRAFNLKGAGLDGRLSLQGAAGSDNPGIEFTVNDNTSRGLIRLDPIGSNGTALEFFTEPDGGDITQAITLKSDGNLELHSHDIVGVTDITVGGVLAIPGFTNVSASLASATAGGLTGVTAGDGLTGGGTSGTVTLNVVGGTGITANANDIAVDATIATVIQLNASSSTLQSNIDGKQATLTFGKSSGNALKSEEALTTNDVLLMGSSNVKGRTYTQFRSDINVEDGADVTDTTNVTAAGALMDSEVTNLAQVKAFDSSDYATAAQGTKADTAIQPADTGSFSTATGVENNADVTDTTNVTAAGALMDSELSEIATVKALTAAGISGSFTAASASFSTRVTANDAKLTANTSNVTSAGALMDSELTDLAGVKGVTISTLQVKPSEGAFANGDKTKLNGIEASADVTDTSNVTSAGALMDSEVTNLAQVKAFDSSDYATAAQGTKADTAIQPSQTSSFSTATGVENNADVTDVTNVTAAGALMDSEVTNLAQVKAFDSSDYATSTQGTKADNAATLIQLNASSSALQSNIDGKQATLTFGKSSGNALKSEEALTTNDILLAGSSNIKGRTYAELKSDLSLNNVTNESKATMFTSPTFTGTMAIPGFSDVSASLAAASGGGGGDITAVTAGTGLSGGGASGDVTLNVDATIATVAQLNTSSSALQTNIDGKQATLTFGISNTNVIKAGSGIVDNDFLRVDGTTLEGRSSAQVLSDIGAQSGIGDGDLTIAFTDGLQDALDAKQATLTFGKSSGNALKSEEALTTNDILLMGSSNVKGRTFSELRSDINVEDGADVTDTTNVTAAGALMDSELTDLAGVKGVTISTLQVKPSEGAFANGDKTKLDGIEASADVTDTANVTSAGALMDSELTDLAAVKAINQGLTTTSDVTFDDIISTSIKAPSIILAKTSTTDADHHGDVVFFGGTIGMDAGKIYHYTSGGAWELSNATDNTKSTGLLAVALGAVSDTNGMLIKGMVTLDHDPGAVGDKLFLRASDGRALNSAPGSIGSVTRVIGYCLDASNGQIYFNPSNDFIVHA